MGKKYEFYRSDTPHTMCFLTLNIDGLLPVVNQISI